MSETDDLEQTGSQTKQMRAVRARLKEDEIRAEYEAKEQAEIRDMVRLHDKRIDKLEWWVAAVKWAGGSFVLGVIGVILKLVFGD